MSTLLRDSRMIRKWKAIRRADYALKQRLDRIDFEEDVLLPEIQAILSGKSTPALPANSAFEISIEDNLADHLAPAAGDPNGDAAPEPDAT